MKISEIQNDIIKSVSKCLYDEGFIKTTNHTFYFLKDNIFWLVTLVFLNKINARYFNSNTSSFSLELGINFNFESETTLKAHPSESSIKGLILRDFNQKHPMDLKNFTLFHPERKRRDIWWVEKDGSNLDIIKNNVCQLIEKKAIKWFKKYSDIDYAIKLLKTKNEVNLSKGGPCGFGAKKSPHRIKLIEQLTKKTRA